MNIDVYQKLLMISVLIIKLGESSNWLKRNLYTI